MYLIPERNGDTYQLCFVCWRETFLRWWSGTNSYWPTSNRQLQGITQRNPSTPSWTTFPPPSRFDFQLMDFLEYNFMPFKWNSTTCLTLNHFLDNSAVYQQMELLQNFYETTLDALKEAKNERLWFKTNTKLGKLYFDRGDYQKLQKILKQLHLSCQVSRDRGQNINRLVGGGGAPC